MPLLFSSLFSGGTGGAPAPEPEPSVPYTTGLLYHFDASAETFSDAAGLVPAVDGDPVARWGNLGTQEDAVQATEAQRPIFGTGGLAGRSYIACSRALQQHFEDLAFTQPGGDTDINPFTVFLVTDAIGGLSDFPSILGSPATNGGKVALYFRAPASQQIHFTKSQVRFGNVTNPQLLMVTIGRNAAGETSTPYSRYWIRQNRAGAFPFASATTVLNFNAVTSTQFLRCSSIPASGYFDGRLYAFLLYDGTLDDATTFAIEDWLADRYGLA